MEGKGITESMNDNIKDLLRLIEEHSNFPVIPMVGQDIVADCTGEWVAHFGKAEVKKMCIYGENVIFREEKNAIKTVEALDLEGLTEGRTREESIEKLNGYLDELGWLEAIIVHIETPIVNIPDNTEKIYEVQEG